MSRAGRQPPPLVDPEHLAALNRRELLFRSANGFGALALAGLLAGCSRDSASGPGAGGPAAALSAAKAGGQRPAEPAQSCIFLYMAGGPSHIDTFDPKPQLEKEHGQICKFKAPPVQFGSCQVIMQSPFRFARYGQSGLDVSEIFPHVATCADELAVVRSMVTDHGEHGTGNYFMHTGAALAGRPSLGAWLAYGLGSLNDDLPGYVVLESGRIPVGGLSCFSNGFLPANYRGVVFHQGKAALPDLAPRERAPEVQRAKVALVEQINRGTQARLDDADGVLDAIIRNYETAFGMQTAVPDVTNFADETAETLSLYGIDRPETEAFGRQCLAARRLVERGVRFVQLLPVRLPKYDQWDQHEHLEEGHRANATATDRPIAALIKDLRRRGLLDRTLLVWGGEFGRTPMEHTMPADTHSRDGRGHNPYGFSMWLAGGGVRPGTIYGRTDEYGLYAIENPVHVHDLHATILHLMGIDHTQLTFRYGGRDFRLTDVYGRVVEGLVA